MESRNITNITMQYLTLRWFTISNFDEKKLKLFHSLERALKTASKKNMTLCWHLQSENYLKEEFKKIIKMKHPASLKKLEKFDKNLKNFLNQNKIEANFLLKDIDFMQKCDCIIYRHAHTINNTSNIITSLP